jgi:hypothetical protein
MSQTSDNSRTFRVLNLTDAVKTQLVELKAVVTQNENVNYVEVVDVPSITAVKKVLDDGEMKYKQCSYSTFVRFKDELTVDQLKKVVTDLCENVNVLYSRVDENNHTGKLVVDRLEDYNTLKGNTGDVSFYRFSPLNVPRVQNRNYTPGQRQETNDNGGEWQPVRAARNNTVRGRYASAVGPVPSQPVATVTQTTAPTRGRGNGRGRPSTRGRVEQA